MARRKNVVENYDIAADEWKRTNPDLLVYHPKGWQHHDGENEHFLVFEAPSGDLLAMWNQASWEGADDHRVVLARSKDEGVSWSDPITIAEAPSHKPRHMCSWGFPVVSRAGRIYCFYNQHTGIVDLHHQFTGEMHCKYSDDDGSTWSQAFQIPMLRRDRDHPDDTVPANWICWQKPIRDAEGYWLGFFTRWSSAMSRPAPPRKDPWGWDAWSELMRFDNIDEGPHPEDLKITWLPENGGVSVPFPYHPQVSNAQEPSVVVLPDKRLFMAMRTMTGHIWYTVSEDNGAHWRQTEILRYKDGDRGINQPMNCCPIYPLEDGRFVLIFHNNDGTANGGTDPGDTARNRRPAFISVGEYREDAHQAIWFSQPKLLADTDGVRIGPLSLDSVCIYTSFTERNGTRVLWYPDRKYFLLGKYITDEFLADCVVPK